MRKSRPQPTTTKRWWRSAPGQQIGTWVNNARKGRKAKGQGSVALLGCKPLGCRKCHAWDLERAALVLYGFPLVQVAWARRSMANKSSATTSRTRLLFLRFLAISAAVLVVLGIIGTMAFHFFQGWRARDLAEKSLRNLEDDNFRMAWLQLNSARALRENDVEVLRAAAVVESRFGLPSALEYWDRLEKETQLTTEELVERARATARFGSKDRFDAAALAVENAGLQLEAAQLRAARFMSRGDMDAAIEETARTADVLDDPGLKLDYARLLLRRHMDRLSNPQDNQTAAIADKISSIIDSLAGTAQEKEALALGLAFLQPAEDKRSQWTDQALQDLSADNPALLAAASVAVQSGRDKPADLYRRLRPVFDAAPLDRRAAFSLWLTRQSMPAEALTLITVQEASESPEAFAARVEALGAMKNWNALIETSNTQGKAPASARLASRARAEFASGYAQSGMTSAADAVRAAAADGNLEAVMVSMDAIGAQPAVDNALVELCGDSRYANKAFRLARERLTRREARGGAALAAAVERVAAASPDSPALGDYRRYVALLEEPAESGSEDKVVQAPTPEETGKAVEANPTDPAVRITHGLALVRAGRAKEALATFDEFTVYFNRLPPPMQAALSSILAAGGESRAATDMARRIDRTVLAPEEVALLQALLPP